MRIPLRIATGAMAAVGVVPAAMAQLSFQTELLIQDTMFNNPVSVAVDPDGAVHLAYTSQFSTDSTSKEVWYATNATGDWEYNQITNNNVREEFPYLMIDSSGVLHLTFHTGFPDSGPPGNQVRYTNSAIRPLIEAGEADLINISPDNVSYILPKIDVDADGVVHFAFQTQRFGGPRNDIVYTTWDAVNGVGPLVFLTNNSAIENREPAIAVGPDGVVHIAYEEGNGVFANPLVYQNNDTPTGDFQTVGTGLFVNVARVGILADSTGKVTIGFRNDDTFAIIESNGAGFTPMQDLTARGQFRAAFYDKFALGPDDKRYFAFCHNIASLGQPGVYLIAETENGFTEPIRMEGNAPQSNVSASVSVGQNGTVAVGYTFSDFRTTVVADLYIAISDDDACIADLNGDGVVDADDFFLFLQLFAAGDMRADINSDGVIDADDFFAYLTLFAQGC
ncbi:MAG: hypothetical protein EA423_07895 [Phycisphaerales bacterium]|nr:MAG: hypothetical protein EA423_07895 [Phycisphaerales bacterium]